MNRLAIVVAVDRSRSTDLAFGSEARLHDDLRKAEAAMQRDDRIATVVFGADAAVEDPLHGTGRAALSQIVEVGRDATDIEVALRRSIAELPADAVGRIVLYSDGAQTRGDAMAAATSAAAAGIAVDVVPLEQRAMTDVRLVSVRAPSRVDKGEPFELRVTTSSTSDADIKLRVRRDDGGIRTVDAHIAKGEDLLRLREIGGEPGLHRYDVQVTAVDAGADMAPDDNDGTAFVRVRGEALTLILEGDVGQGAPLRRAFEASGFRATERSTTEFPADVGELALYDLVVLSDVRAADLVPAQIDALSTYARDLGGGLILMGGDRSMGPGGYARTSLEEVSPVTFDLKEEKRRASLAEVIAIDYSGSMGVSVGGHTKLELANEAAARSASLLSPEDQLGVEHVDTVVKWTVPMGPVTNRRAIGDAIRDVAVGGGGIYTDLSLQAGYAALAGASADLKHLLLFADGSDAEQIDGCRAIVAHALERGVTTSVISLGRGSDSPELEALSKAGAGRYYLIEDATKLPAVFTQETILATRSAIHEVPFRAVPVSAGPSLRGVDLRSQPLLDGYVVTQAKPRATLLLSAPGKDPLLATWSVGIGRTAAFTSDYKDRWGQHWLGWSDAARLFGQLGREIARKADDPHVRLETEASGGVLQVRASVVGEDNHPHAFRRLQVHISGPDGFGRDKPLDPVGPGRYSAAVPLSRAGTYLAAVKDDTSGELLGTLGAVMAAGEELRPTGTNHALLESLAAVTHGKMRNNLEGLFDDRPLRRFTYHSLSGPLAIFTAIATLLWVALRRVGLPNVVGMLLARIRNQNERARVHRAAEKEAATGASREAIADQLRWRDAVLARRLLADPLPVASVPILAPPLAPKPQPEAPALTANPTIIQARPLTSAEHLAMKRRARR